MSELVTVNTISVGLFGQVLVILESIVMSLLIVAVYTLGERKLMAAVQRRVGPNVNGYAGLLQPFADALKLIFKEVTVPLRANPVMFILSPVLFLAVSLSQAALLPNPDLMIANTTIPLQLVFYLVILSLQPYFILFAGWASNSKYAFLGAIRSAAQLLSYELPFGFIILTLILLTNSLNFIEILYLQAQLFFFDTYLICLVFPLALFFFIIMLAETNRIPFDLPESESELVAGYNVDYSSILFAFFFLGEYFNMLVGSIVFIIFFFSATIYFSFFFYFKVVCIAALFVLVRSALPRYRYDQVMFMGWHFLLPLTYSIFLFILALRSYNDWYNYYMTLNDLLV